MSDVYEDLKSLVNGATVSGSYTITTLWDDSAADANQDYIVIQENGVGGSDEDVERTSFDIFIIGSVNGGDYKQLWDDAKAIFRHLTKNYLSGCIIGLTAFNSPNSPRRMDDNRYISNFTLSGVLYSIRA